MIKTKVFAAYLPQYHEIPENNEFWGTGFTDWVGVKASKPLFEEHSQPRIPLNQNYYDLSHIDSIRWQAELAKSYGVSGFNIYHYWFKDGHQVLEKPAELLLENKDIDIEFFFSWDNTSWVRSWSNISGNAWSPLYDKGNTQQSPQVLLELSYGNEEAWKKHFDYLLNFFKDKRYLKIDNKPVVALMKPDGAETIVNMFEYWNTLAIECGFEGIYGLIGQKAFGNKKILDAYFIYEPRSSGWAKYDAIASRIKKYLKIDLDKKKSIKHLFDYENVWKKIINKQCSRNDSDHVMCGFVRYDDSPRRGKNATVIKGDTPKLFAQYFKKLYRMSCNNNKPFMLLTAWNEWGEGAYLEPDEESGYAYLEALKKVIESFKE